MALPQFGTNTTFDTFGANNQTIAQFGEDNAWDGVASLVDAYNSQVTEATANLIEITTSRLRRYGGPVTVEMQRMDEMGTPNTQKGRPGVPAGFPLENWGIALQWTLTYMKTKRVSDLAGQVEAFIAADKRRLLRNIKIAIYNAVNYNFTDYLVDHLEIIPLPVKALLNADGLPIPPGPNGEIFDGHSHTHYQATASLTDAWLKSLVVNVQEHYNTGQTYLYIHNADQTAISALTGFKALTYVTTIRATTQEYGEGYLDRADIYNRLIGYFYGAEVWVKPWAIQNYPLAWQSGVPKPLVKRIRGQNPDSSGDPIDGAGDLVLTYEDEIHPLRAKAWEHEYGISVWNRTAMAVGYLGGTIYVQPTIT